MNRLGNTIATIAIVGLSAIGLSACGGTNDADVGGRDTAPANVVNFPNHFSSIATKCDNGNRLYESDHGEGDRASSITVVPHDPSCPQRNQP